MCIRDRHKIVAIGTTVMRTVETAVSTNGMIKAMEGWTNKFIFAPYEFTVADAMVVVQVIDEDDLVVGFY